MIWTVMKDRAAGIWEGVNDALDKHYNNDRVLIASILLYKILLDITYLTYVAKSYHYYGFNAQYDIGRILIVNVAFLLSIPFFCDQIRGENGASNYVMVVLGFTYYIPGLSFITFHDCPNDYILFYLSFFAMLCLINHIVINLSDRNANVIRDYKNLFLVLLVALIVICSFYVLKYQGFKIKISLDDVYDERARYSQVAQGYSVLFGYLKSSISKIIPVLAYIMCKKRRFVLVVFLAMLQLSLFAMGANKIDFFWLIIAIGASLVRDLGNKWIVTGYFFLSLASAVSSLISETVFNNMIVRRMMFVPNLLSFLYFDFFRSQSYIWFSDTVLRGLVNYPFDDEISYIIGDVMKKGSGCNGNNGLAGVSFANCGYWGIIVFPILYGIIFYLLNWFSRYKDRGVVILVSFMLAIIYIDCNYFTALFTHGVFLLLLFMMLLPRGEIKKRKTS